MKIAEKMQRWEMNELGRANLKLKTVPVPRPGANEVPVKVSAIALNYRDNVMIDTGMECDDRYWNGKTSG